MMAKAVISFSFSRPVGPVLLCLLALLALASTGCNPPSPTPIVQAVTVTPTLTATPTATPLPNATIVEQLTRQATLAPATATTSATPAATPSAVSGCEPPEGWLPYTVRFNDTLSTLALITNTTVEAIKQANCLLDEVIYVDDILYLPSLPPSYSFNEGSANEGSSATTTPCPPFSCPFHSLTRIPILPGGPNEGFVPCGDTPANAAAISTRLTRLESGRRIFYFVCNFPAGAQLTAEMRRSDGVTQTVPILSLPPNPEIILQPGQRVIVWSQTCDLPTGEYTLTVSDHNGRTAMATTRVIPPRTQRILVIPQVRRPGEGFDVYYCGYPADQPVVIEFFREDGRDADGTYRFGKIGEWEITIGPAGWQMEPLHSFAGDPLLTYYVADQGPSNGEDKLWLVP